MTSQSAASTPSSATRPGTVSSCRKSNGSPPVLLNWPLPPPLPPAAAASSKLRDQGDEPLASEFDAAKLRADRLGQLESAVPANIRFLGGGDINLYSIFVERAMRLIKPDGIVGLLTPSGIYADKTAARFFKSISTSGRVGGLFDFENKKIFFKDVHASFKFCALIFGGEERRFDRNRMRLLPA